MVISGYTDYLLIDRNRFLHFIVNLQTAVHLAGIRNGLTRTSGVLLYQSKQENMKNKFQKLFDQVGQLFLLLIINYSLPIFF